jgi:hypothetical protein
MKSKYHPSVNNSDRPLGQSLPNGPHPHRPLSMELPTRLGVRTPSMGCTRTTLKVVSESDLNDIEFYTHWYAATGADV